MTEHIVADAEDIGEDERIIVEVEGREIGIFRHDDEYYALLNWCAHQAGPCAEGSVTGTIDATFDRESLELIESYTREGEILNCPWHGWEYDLKTGKCLSRSGVELPSYSVEERAGKIVLSI